MQLARGPFSLSPASALVIQQGDITKWSVDGSSNAIEGGGEPLKGSLGWAIDTHFGSLEALAQKMSAEGAALQGSGWVWFGVDKELKKLVVETTANQVIFKRHLISVFGIDIIILSLMIFLSMVSYKNVRPDYLKNIWKVINWKYASEVFEKECP
ncbi:hypothetical protein CDL15_Pgr022469 [Punica granatum]|uniref:superoxide dismutase n=1 Tax=Punica granatum TaxID=22663 RepID=A0A218XRC5_PUNGR|nr:hypothetical protein CDL15_Pgr022469 [Punica granatum]